MQRALSPDESWCFFAGARVLLACEITGRIDREILGESVRTLARFLPVLTAKFVPTDNGCLIRIDDDAPPLEIHHSEDFEAELNLAPNWLVGPLLRVALIEGRTRTTVALSLPRAFADGMSFIALHQRLWGIYTELLAGNSVKTYPITPILPPSLEELILNSTSQADIDAFLAERAARTAGVHPSRLPVAAQAPGADRYANFAVHRMELNRSRTKRFVDAAHSADLTVHGLVCGVILAGVRGVLQPKTGPLVLTCDSPVDMRTRLIPPIPPDIVQSAASWSIAILTVSEESDPVDLGRQVCESIRDDLAKGIPAYEIATFSSALAGGLEKNFIPLTIVVTNLHRIPDPPLPPGLEAVDWRIIPLCNTPFSPFAAVTCYDQRLAIDLSFSRNWYDDDMMRELLLIAAAKIDRIVGA